jgi:signal transduction histidine kinase
VSRSRAARLPPRLGLDIARRAAESGGGSLRIDNDHGAVVTLELPVLV